MKVLVAEGSREVTERLMMLIKEIPTAELLAPTATAHATLKSVRTNSPDVLVLDARIPGAQGMEPLKTIRQEIPAVVLLVLSNVVYPQSRERYNAAGADLFLDKSDEFLLVQQFIRELVRYPQIEADRTSKERLRRRLAVTELFVRKTIPTSYLPKVLHK